MLIFWDLGEVEMTLPVWYMAGDGWTLSGYKVFSKAAIGLETYEFRRVCKYLRVREHELINLLFRLSMLSVVQGQQISEKRQLRQQFKGRRKGEFADNSPLGTAFGFVIERRRSEGKFRRRVQGVANTK
jgi:hypothetical protein